MAVQVECRHYLRRGTAAGDAVERCRLGVNEEHPFACPQSCLFFEQRTVSTSGWTQPSSEPMSNTGLGLLDIPEPKKRGRKGKKKGR